MSFMVNAIENPNSMSLFLLDKINIIIGQAMI